MKNLTIVTILAITGIYLLVAALIKIWPFHSSSIPKTYNNCGDTCDSDGKCPDECPCDGITCNKEPPSTPLQCGDTCDSDGKCPDECPCDGITCNKEIPSIPLQWGDT
jgi:hypothetical protein